MFTNVYTPLAEGTAVEHIPASNLSLRTPRDDHDIGCSLEAHMKRASCLLLEHDLEVPDVAQLRSIVLLGLQAQQCFFAAAIVHPSTERISAFLSGFVLQSVESEIVPAAPP